MIIRRIGTIGLVWMLIASVVGMAFAQENDVSNPLPTAVCRSQWEPGQNLADWTDAFGMTVVEIRAYLADGGTLEELAAEKGVDLDALRSQLEVERLAELETCLNEAVASETITQAQADWVLQMAQLAAQRPELLESCRPLAAHLNLNELVAQTVGMTLEELRAYLADGGNLRELLADNDLDLETIREQAQATVLADLQTCLSEGVANGTITQAQADFLLERATNFERGEWRGQFPGLGNRMPGMPGNHGGSRPFQPRGNGG